jgi:hypothetical protein
MCCPPMKQMFTNLWRTKWAKQNHCLHFWKFTQSQSIFAVFSAHSTCYCVRGLASIFSKMPKQDTYQIILIFSKWMWRNWMISCNFSSDGSWLVWNYTGPKMKLLHSVLFWCDAIWPFSQHSEVFAFHRQQNLQIQDRRSWLWQIMES